MFDALKEFCASLIIGALTSFDDMVLDAMDILNGGTFNTTVWGRVIGISNILKPFCYVVIGICLLIELAQVAAKVDIIKWEHGLKLCIKMVFARLCIDNAPIFLRACYNQAVLWIGSLGASYSRLSSSLTSEIQTSIDSISGIGAILGLAMTGIILSLAIKVCGLLVEVIAFGRMFELYVYLAVSPLPCAFFPLGDGSGGGMSRVTMKFVKSFVAVCLQGVMILICIAIFSTIMDSTMQTLITRATGGSDAGVVVSDLCYTMLLAGIVLVMAVAKCGSWAKGILDAM